MDSGKGNIELLERKFAESYMANYISRINITNRKDFLIINNIVCCQINKKLTELTGLKRMEFWSYIN